MCRPMPEWRWSWLYQAKNAWQCARAASIEVNRAGEAGPVLQGLELRFGERVVVADVRAGECDWVTPRSASRNATGLEVIEEPRSAWMVSCPRLMPCFAQVSAMSFSARAADSRVASIQPIDVTGMDVEDDVEVVVRPFRRAVQLGDVPRPDLIRAGGEQLGLHRGGVDGLPAALAGLPGPAQQPVEGGLRAQVGALVQQDRPDLGRGQVSEPRRSAGRPGWPAARPGPGRGAGPGPGAAPARAGPAPGWPGGGGTSWPAARPPPGRRPGCRSAAPAR